MKDEVLDELYRVRARIGKELQTNPSKVEKRWKLIAEEYKDRLVKIAYRLPSKKAA